MLIINDKYFNITVERVLITLKDELKNGKLSYWKDNDTTIQVQCPSHSGGLEKHPSCGIWKDSGYCNCLTCGFKGPLNHFIAEAFNENDDFGMEWLEERFGYEIYNKPLNIDAAIVVSLNSSKYLDENVLNTYKSYHPYMTLRKLSKPIIEKFKIKYDEKTNCILFPTWDENDNLIFISKRSISSKNFYIEKDIEKPIYLLNTIINENIKEVVVCESQINALTCWSYGVPAIATFGCKVSEKQINLLNKSGIRHFILGFDGDDAGREGTKNLINKLRKDVLIDVLEIPNGKDINDLDRDHFLSLLKKVTA